MYNYSYQMLHFWQLHFCLFSHLKVESILDQNHFPFDDASNTVWWLWHTLILCFRGFALVGPFVVMIYQMLRRDFIIFFIIYMIFVIGFSQGGEDLLVMSLFNSIFSLNRIVLSEILQINFISFSILMRLLSSW